MKGTAEEVTKVLSRTASSTMPMYIRFDVRNAETHVVIIREKPHAANVAELADAPDLGSGSRKGMGVRPSPFAPFCKSGGSPPPSPPAGRPPSFVRLPCGRGGGHYPPPPLHPEAREIHPLSSRASPT